MHNFRFLSYPDSYWLSYTLVSQVTIRVLEASLYGTKIKLIYVYRDVVLW